MTDLPRVHEPVLVEEVLAALEPRGGETVVDLTVGAGGHAARILERSAPDGRLLGVDRDPRILEHAKARLEGYGERVRLERGVSDELKSLLKRTGIGPVHGILLDLGVSSLQLDDAERGFSLMREGPLDMRMTPGKGITAQRLIAESDAETLERIFRDYGDEPAARRIAQRLVDLCRRRPPRTTSELASFVASLAPQGPRGRSRIHPATRVFQALRIAVNDEFGVLERTLPQAVEALAPGGRLAVIAFHSAEDRIVKNFLRDARRAGTMEVVHKKPVVPGEPEIARNPRARSARLRAARRRTAAGEGLR